MDTQTVRFIRSIREACSGRNHTDRPDHELRDHLWARYQREVVNIPPEDRESIEREIRRGTGT
jgi:hypothetical protein